MRKHPAAALIATLFAFLTTSCASTTDVISTDLTRQSGIYVVGYVDREDIRAKLEDKFVADLEARSLRGVASRHDLPAIKRVKPADIVRAANAHQVAAIMIINRVQKDGSESIITSEQRIAPGNPDLDAYYALTRQELDVYDENEPVFAEVNAFFVDGRKTRRFWTGSTWTFAGEDDQVIGNISETIATEMAKVAGEMRSYGRPMR